MTRTQTADRVGSRGRTPMTAVPLLPGPILDTTLEFQDVSCQLVDDRLARRVTSALRAHRVLDRSTGGILTEIRLWSDPDPFRGKNVSGAVMVQVEDLEDLHGANLIVFL